MKNTKRIITFLLVFILFLNFGTINSKAAASVSIALSSGSVSIGGSVTATVSISGSDISAYDIYVSYDSSVLQFVSGSGSAQVNGGGGTIRLVGTGAGSTSLSFTAIGNGNCYISTSGSEVYDINYNQLEISHAGASVTVATVSDDNSSENNSTTEAANNNTTEANDDSTTEEDNRSANCNLKSLQISPGKLEPAFSASTTYYFVQVDEDVTSMVVSAVAEDEKAITAVRGAGLIEPGANTVTITVTAENGAVKVYTLSVAAGEVLGDAKTNINGIEYSFIQSSKGLEYPEGYKEITTTYKDWDILAFESPNKKIVLVCLEPQTENSEDSVQEWFIYDKDSESFIPYREYSSEFNRYVIMEAPEGTQIPDGFKKTEYDIGGIGEKVAVYKSDDIKDRNIYLVYAINIADGEGFYWYDAKEKSFLRYAEKEETVATETVATETIATATEPEKIIIEETNDTGFFNKKNLSVIAGVLGVLSLIFLVIIFTLAVMLRGKKEYEKEENDTLENALTEESANDNNTGDKEILTETDYDNSSSDDDSANGEEYNQNVGVSSDEEERRAYEEDRDVKPVSFDLSNMQDEKSVETADRNIQIMSFKKKEEAVDNNTDDNVNENAEADSSNDYKDKSKEIKMEIEENEEVTEKVSEKVSDESKDNDLEKEDYIETIKYEFEPKSDENDYAKQSEAINNKIKNDYDAEKDSAFSDDLDK